MAKSLPYRADYGFWFVIVFVIGSLWMSSAQGELKLDALTACADIAMLDKSLRSAPTAAASECRPPKGALESTLFERVGGRQAGLCFRRSAPAPFLGGYSCVQPPSKGGAATLECFRAARASDVASYKREFGDRNAVRANQYEVAASKCEVTNGNTAKAPPTTFSPLLALIARMDFGFTSPIGKGRKTDSYVQHGYASTDPSIDGDVPSAIEYVSLLVAAPAYVANNERRAVGDWILRTDESKEVSDFLNDFFRKNKVPVYTQGAIYEISKPGAITLSRDKKLDFVRNLQNAIVSRLEGDGFEDLSDDELKEKTGKTRAQLSRQFRQGIPFGRRQLMATDKVGDIRVLVSSSKPACTEKDDALLAAYLMPINPVPEVDSDFGGFMFAVLGVGSCSRIERPSTSAFMGRVSKLVGSQLIETLQKK